MYDFSIFSYFSTSMNILRIKCNCSSTSPISSLPCYHLYKGKKSPNIRLNFNMLWESDHIMFYWIRNGHIQEYKREQPNGKGREGPPKKKQTNK